MVEAIERRGVKTLKDKDDFGMAALLQSKDRSEADLTAG